MGCHFLLQGMRVKSESEVAQLCLTLSDPMDCSSPGFSIHGIFQARVLEWGAIAFSAQGTYLSTNMAFMVLSTSDSVQFSSVTQSCLTLCDPMNPSTPASLSITNSRSSLRLTSIESVMPSSHLILCHPLLLPPIPPSTSLLQ